MTAPAARSARPEDAVFLLLVCKTASLALVQQDFRSDAATLGWYALVAVYLAAALACACDAWPRAAQRPLGAALAVSALVAAVLAFQGTAFVSFDAQPAGLDWALLAACCAGRAVRAIQPEPA